MFHCQAIHVSLSVASRDVCVRFLLLKFNLFAFVAIDLDTWRFSCSRFTFRDQSLLFVCEQLPTWPAPTVPAAPLADVELLLVAVVVEPRVLQGGQAGRCVPLGGQTVLEVLEAVRHVRKGSWHDDARAYN